MLFTLRPTSPCGGMSLARALSSQAKPPPTTSKLFQVERSAKKLRIEYAKELETLWCAPYRKKDQGQKMALRNRVIQMTKCFLEARRDEKLLQRIEKILEICRRYELTLVDNDNNNLLHLAASCPTRSTRAKESQKFYGGLKKLLTEEEIANLFKQTNKQGDTPWDVGVCQENKPFIKPFAACVEEKITGNICLFHFLRGKPLNPEIEKIVYGESNIEQFHRDLHRNT